MPFGDCGDDPASEVVNHVVDRAALILYENYLNERVFSYVAARSTCELVELVNVIEMARRCQCNFSVGACEDQEAAVQDIDLWARKLTPIKPMTAKYHTPLSTSRTNSSTSQHKLEENKCLDTRSVGSSHVSKTTSACTSPNKKRTLKDAVVVKVIEPRASADDRQAEETRRKSLLELLETMATQAKVEVPEKEKKPPQKKKQCKTKTYSIQAPAINVEPVEEAVRVEYNVADIGDKALHIHHRPPTRCNDPSREKPHSARSLHPQDSFNENLNMRIPSSTLHSIESLVPAVGVRIAHPGREEDSIAGEMPYLSPSNSAACCKETSTPRAATPTTTDKPNREHSSVLPWKNKDTKIQDRQTQKIPVTRKQSQRSHPQYVVQEFSPSSKVCHVVRVVSPPKPANPSKCSSRKAPPGTMLITSIALVCRRAKLK